MNIQTHYNNLAKKYQTLRQERQNLHEKSVKLISHISNLDQKLERLEFEMNSIKSKYGQKRK